MLLSFIVATYNRADLLPRLIAALVHQQTAEDLSFEAIFVDNGSTDSTPAVLNDAVRQYPHLLRYIRIAPTGGPSAPRNTGIRAAAGEALIIIDDDFIPDPDLFLRYAEFHARFPEAHHAAVGATYMAEDQRDKPLSMFCDFDYSRLQAQEPLDFLHFWTRNLSVKRDFMLRAGMFDESFLYYEDVLCGYRLENAGLHLHFWLPATGRHLQKTTVKGLPARNRFMGRWLYRFQEVLGHDPRVASRLAAPPAPAQELPWLQHILDRLAARAVANRAVLWLLGELVGHLKRSSLTDRLFQRIASHYFYTGYIEAKVNAEAGNPLNLLPLQTELADRGDR